MARKYSTGTKTLNGIPRSPPRAAAIAALNAISAQPFFARENGFFESLLARDSVGRSIRSRIMLGWGLFSITFSYSCLRFVYGHSSEESFFIGTTNLYYVYFPTKCVRSNNNFDNYRIWFYIVNRQQRRPFVSLDIFHIFRVPIHILAM